MDTQEKFLDELLHPGTEFSPMPFWFFNDDFDEERVRGQLEDYVEKGVNGFVLHPRIGIPRQMPYLSEEYFRAVRFIVRTAAELKMKVVLYDEGMYPSGSAHGMVVESNPEYASKGIILLEEKDAEARLEAEPGAQVIARLQDGRQIVYCFTGGTIRGIHFGEDDGEPGAPKAADILNPLAVEEFIRLTHDRYYEELKEYFGSTVIAFFTDEPSALGRNAGRYRPWVQGLERELEALGSKASELEGLFMKTGKTVAGREDIAETQDNRSVRLYHKLIKKKLREIFYARLSGWCESHGIGLIGHPAESDDIEEELYFHIPGQDLIMRRVSPETGGLREFDSVQAKLSADIARHLGRRRNANECFGVCYRDRIPWYMTAGDMKWYIDWLGLRGVNLYIPHAFYYSVAGERKGERPPDVGPNNIWWSHYKLFSDYMKRLSYLMTDSVNGAQVAVLCDNNQVPYEEIACLYENQIEFNYLPAALLEQAEVREGRVCIRDYAYKGVLNLLGEAYEERFQGKLGDLLWTAPESGRQDAAGFLRRCLEAVGSGQNPMAEGFRTEPERGCQLPETDRARPGAAAGILTQQVTFDTPCKNLRMVRLNKMGLNMLFLGNEGSETLGTGIRISGMKSPLLVDLWKGRCHKLEGAGEYFWLSLKPSETVLVTEGEGVNPGSLQQSGQTGQDGTGVPLERECPCRTADNAQRSTGCPDWTDRFELTEKKDNKAVYVLQYQCRESQIPLPEREIRFLVRGQEMVECYCNGAFVDVSFWGAHRFSLRGFLQEGQNEIRLVVTGNAANIYENAGIAFGLKV